MNPYLKQYQQTQIQTASPEKLLIMLYDGAIQFLNKALRAIQDQNIQESHNNIVGAQKIIAEFMNTLDLEVGGDAARSLYNLYEYLHYRLVQSNINKNPEMITEVIDHLKGLKQTWEEAIKIAQKEKLSGRSSSLMDEENDYEEEEELVSDSKKSVERSA